MDAAAPGGCGPTELAGVPFDEGFGFCGYVQVLVQARVGLADLGVAALDQQPVSLGRLATGEVELNYDASIREPVSAKRVAHRPQSHEWIEGLRGDLEPAGPPP